MDYTLQEIIIGVLVALAIFVLIRKFTPRKGKACGKDCESCDISIENDKREQ